MYNFNHITSLIGHDLFKIIDMDNLINQYVMSWKNNSKHASTQTLFF